MKTGPFATRRARARGKLLWAGMLRALGLLGLAKSWVRRNGAIVLTFHRVLGDRELNHTASLPGMIVRARTFDHFLEYLGRECDVFDLSRGPDWRQQAKLKIAVTFDDGWSDNATSAFPLARQHNIPITIFIVPQRTGIAWPFWPEQAGAVLGLNTAAAEAVEDRASIEQVIEGLKGLTADERKLHIDRILEEQEVTRPSAPVDKTMSWEQIFRLHAGGVIFGSHTSTHEILVSIPLDQAQVEIAGSRALIEKKIGARCSLFAYPNGNCSQAVRDLVARAGYKLAFLNQDPGVWTPDCDHYQIPRVNVCEYHLVDPQGKFSRLIFDYSVVWKAARGLLSDSCARFLLKLMRWRRPLAGPRGDERRANQAG